jgi:hypothetical protein
LGAGATIALKGDFPMPLNAKVEESLHSSNPFEQLRLLVVSLQGEGFDRGAILHFFEEARQNLRNAGREADEDIVMDVMDCLVGWCSPKMSLEPERRQ